jgi:predicted alpha/beta superfamily hydrolase
VYLPEGYDPARKYPVLYTCDGEGVFDRETAHNQVELGLDEKAAELVAQGKMSEVIIVAVASGGTNVERFRDYAPVADARYGGGGADKYLAFLQEELKPMVDATYSTATEAGRTGIMGSSLGGLFALYAGFVAPHTFGLVGALSPSLWVANRDMLHRMVEATEGPEKVWIDMGTKEQKDPRLSQDRVDEFRVAELALQEHGYQPGQTMFAHLIEGGVHSQNQFKLQAGDLMESLFPADEFRRTS